MAKTKTVTLLSSSQRTSTGTGSATSTKIKNNVITSGDEQYTKALIVLDVTAAAAGTLDLTIEGRTSSSANWVTLTPSSAWTQVTTSVSEQVRTYENLPQEIRALGTAASSPDHTYSVTAHFEA